MDLELLRAEIDGIDAWLTELFVRRMHVCADVACYKKENGLPILHPAREREVLERVSVLAGDELAGYARVLFATLMDLSRSYQAQLLNEGSTVSGEIEKALAETENVLAKKTETSPAPTT